MDFGEWELQPWAGIQRTALDGWAADPLDYAPPGGESVGQLRKRVLDFIGELAASGLPAAALLAHAGVMKVIVGWQQALPVGEWMALSFEFEGIVVLDIPAQPPA